MKKIKYYGYNVFKNHTFIFLLILDNIVENSLKICFSDD